MNIVFLDDDPVIRIARLVLVDASNDGWIREYFAPEVVDLGVLTEATRGIRASDGTCVELSADPRDADVIVFRRGRVDANVLDANPNLRLVQRFGERPDGVDLVEARRRGIAVSCIPRRTLRYTAEHAILLMLALGKRLLEADRIVRTGDYDRSRVRAIDDVAANWPGMQSIEGLDGKTLGILGLGEVGTLVARFARAFGMHVLYTKRTRADVAEECQLGVEYAPRDELLARADFVSVHAANLPENTNLVGAEMFNAMRPAAFLVNTSRGRLVNEDALYDALVSARIAGAGLDVHRIEPRSVPDRLGALPNVIMTPHFAGGPRSGVLGELRLVLENCRAAAAGTPPRYLVS